MSSSSVAQPKPTNVPAQSESPTSGLGQQYLLKVKLPKLEVKKFSGRLQDWQKFWDSFQSSIDDKFSYLKSLLYKPARSMITGFALTEANYAAAVQALKKGDSYSKSPYQ